MKDFLLIGLNLNSLMKQGTFKTISVLLSVKLGVVRALSFLNTITATTLELGNKS